MMNISGGTVAIVGVGGLGCPAALALVQAGVGRLLLIDDDTVDETNLHRQILYSEDDIGKPKLPAAVKSLEQVQPRRTQLEAHNTRCLPETANQLLHRADVILEGADNYATKFLVCDAARLLQKPVVHGAAVAFQATAFAVSAAGQPCYRCVFEDVPHGTSQNCDTLGVLGPLTGFAGALMADLALQILCGNSAVYGTLHTYNGKSDQLRRIFPTPRPSCPLCGEQPSIHELNEARYLSAPCAA